MRRIKFPTGIPACSKPVKLPDNEDARLFWLSCTYLVLDSYAELRSSQKDCHQRVAFIPRLQAFNLPFAVLRRGVLQLLHLPRMTQMTIKVSGKSWCYLPNKSKLMEKLASFDFQNAEYLHKHLNA